MTDYVKIVNKNFNQELLQEELIIASLAGGGGYWAGFDKISQRIYAPSTVHGHTLGELRFTFDPGLTVAQEETLDAILAAHDSTQLTAAQTNKDSDLSAIAPLKSNYQNWGTLDSAQKDNNHRQLTRLVARLLDSSQDL